MTRSKLGLLSLCAVVFGLMAFQAAAAQAVSWLILDLDGKALELKAKVVGEIESGTHATLLSVITGIEVEILCSAAELINVNLEAGGALTEGGKVKFTGCTVKLNKEASECNPKSTGQPVGTIETLEGKGQLQESGVTVLKPKAGETFVTVQMGAACPIGNNVPITGVLAIEDCKEDANKSGKGSAAFEHLVVHLIQENAAGTTLKALGSKATIDGSANVFLGGTTDNHVGLKWGAMK